jgi:hypothetical protein
MKESRGGCRLAASIGALVLLTASAAVAQIPLSGMTTGMLAMSDADVKILTDTALTLYQKADVKVGDKAVWRDEATGTSGKMLVTDVMREPNLCVSIQHVVKPAAQSDLAVFLIRRCRSDKGEWLISL